MFINEDEAEMEASVVGWAIAYRKQALQLAGVFFVTCL